MKKWAMLLIVFACCSLALAQDPPVRACRKVEMLRSCPDCVFVGFTQGSGYCTFKIVEECVAGCGGACAIAESGDCAVPDYCGKASARANVAENLKLPDSKWISRKYFPETLSAYSFYVGKALRIFQERLQAEDSTVGEWEHTKLVMGSRKIDGHDHYTAELQHVGGEYVITVVRHRPSTVPEDGEEYGAKWTLSMGEAGWSLDSTDGVHANGTF